MESNDHAHTIWIGPKKTSANTSHGLHISHQSVPVIFSNTPPPRPEWAGAWHKPQDEFHKRRRGRWNRSQRPTTRKGTTIQPSPSEQWKKTGCLKYIRDGNPTHLCRDFKKSHYKDPIKHHQPTSWWPHGIRGAQLFRWQQKWLLCNAGGWNLRGFGCLGWPNGTSPSSHQPSSTMKPPTVLPKRRFQGTRRTQSAKCSRLKAKNPPYPGQGWKRRMGIPGSQGIRNVSSDRWVIGAAPNC